MSDDKARRLMEELSETVNLVWDIARTTPDDSRRLGEAVDHLRTLVDQVAAASPTDRASVVESIEAVLEPLGSHTAESDIHPP